MAVHPVIEQGQGQGAGRGSDDPFMCFRHEIGGRSVGLGHQQHRETLTTPGSQIFVVDGGQAGLLCCQIKDQSRLGIRLTDTGQHLQQPIRIGLQPARSPLRRVLLKIGQCQRRHFAITNRQIVGTPAPRHQLAAQQCIVDTLGQKDLSPEPAQLFGRGRDIEDKRYIGVETLLKIAAGDGPPVRPCCFFIDFYQCKLTHAPVCGHPLEEWQPVAVWIAPNQPGALTRSEDLGYQCMNSFLKRITHDQTHNT